MVSDEKELRERLVRPYREWAAAQLRIERDYWRARQLIAQREIEATMRELALIDAELGQRDGD